MEKFRKVSDLAHYLEDGKTFWGYLITSIVLYNFKINYRKCTDPTAIVTRGPILQPVTELETTTDYYGNMGFWVFKKGYKIGKKIILFFELIYIVASCQKMPKSDFKVNFLCQQST